MHARTTWGPVSCRLPTSQKAVVDTLQCQGAELTPRSKRYVRESPHALCAAIRYTAPAWGPETARHSAGAARAHSNSLARSRMLPKSPGLGAQGLWA